jgi:hypothetical protein
MPILFWLPMIFVTAMIELSRPGVKQLEPEVE